MTSPILPGATVGVLGSGQLGRMFAIAARRMGYRVHTFSPDDDTPTGQVADREVQGAYDDLDAVRAFARGVDVVTFEFENVSSAAAEAAAEQAPVRPAGSVLHTTQHRLREKSFLAGASVPVAPFAPVRSAEELHQALAKLGTPAVLKTAGWGYDGKGQVKINTPSESDAAWSTLNTDEAVLEAFVDFAMEVSVVAARGLDGSFAHFGLIANDHDRHILDVSVAPAPVDESIVREAVEIARGILDGLGVVGVLCVEMFLTRDGRLLVNELAPRPHNSGHLTFDACVTSQFEQQLRAICGLPFGATDLLRPAAMANLLGDLWQGGEPDWAAACRFPDVKLHLYGKATARPGRKMGHLTALAGPGGTVGEARQRVLAARARSVDSNVKKRGGAMAIPMNARPWMIYGANGYTGELIAREAVARGLRPVLAGRNATAVGALALELGLDSRAFALHDPQEAQLGIAGTSAVLHCAGPFVRTSKPMVEACLAAGVHYLDITGEIGVFEPILGRRGEDARRAGIALLPGVGFDVVPSDCLAARLARELPDATELILAFAADRGGISRGTMKTMIESLPGAGAVRRDGKIIPVRMAYDAREIDFGGALGKRWTMTIPWGDVSTAFYSTGIPNIRVYTGTPRGAIRRARLFSPFLPLAGLKPVKHFLQRRIDRRDPGPSPQVLETARTCLWGQVKNAAGVTVTATLETPQGYRLTALSAVECARRAAAGQVPPGAWTPSKAFGADFVTELPGVVAGEPVRSGGG